MIRIGLGPIMAAIAGLILAAVVAWWMLTTLETPTAPVPGHAGSPLQPFAATMPPISPFESFYVNDDNPFVPWKERIDEKKRLQAPTTVVIKPQPPTKVNPITPPTLKLPPKAKGGGDAPQVIGFTRQTDGAIDALFQFAGDAKPRQVKAGERIGRWTFVGVENGSVAVFTDETGRQYRMVIGSR